MKKRLLLDTSAVMVLIRKAGPANQIIEKYGLLNPDADPMICVVTLGEIRVLATRNNWGESKRSILDKFLSRCVVVNINHKSVIDAYVALDIASQRHPSGSRNMGKNDLWIAASAKATGATLVTTDKDFDHVERSFLEVDRFPLN